MQYNDGKFEFFRLSNYCEHIYKNVRTLEEEMFEYDINLKWKMKNSY